MGEAIRATITAGVTPTIAHQLLILYAAAGWAVLADVACRIGYGSLRGPRAGGEMEVFADGAIAGDTLTGFYTGVVASVGHFV